MREGGTDSSDRVAWDSPVHGTPTGCVNRAIARANSGELQGRARSLDVRVLSSFLTSLLTGRLAPMDAGDGSGMNLLDIQTREWKRAGFSYAHTPNLDRRHHAARPSSFGSGGRTQLELFRCGLGECSPCHGLLGHWRQPCSPLCLFVGLPSSDPHLAGHV